jgi:predicted Zn-dependent peptidase
VIEGKLVKGVSMKDAEEAIDIELEKLCKEGVSEKELEKVKNKTESAMAFEDMSLVNRAASLALYELLGDANLINTELSRYRSVTAADILEQSSLIFNKKNSNTLHYFSN